MQHREQSHSGLETASWMGLMILLQHQLWLNLFPFGVIKKKETDKRENKKSKISKDTKNKIVCVSLAPYLDNFYLCQPSSITQKEGTSHLQVGKQRHGNVKIPIQSSIKSTAGTGLKGRVPEAPAYIHALKSLCIYPSWSHFNGPHCLASADGCWGVQWLLTTSSSPFSWSKALFTPRGKRHFLKIPTYKFSSRRPEINPFI